MNITTNRIAELENEKREFFSSPRGKAILAKLSDALVSTVELPLDADENDWWEKAAEYLSPRDYDEFVSNLNPGSIKSLVYLRTRIRLAKLTDIEKCCMAWAGRDGITGNMTDFLLAWENNGGGFYSVSMLQRALRRAEKKGLVEKNPQDRWKLPKSRH